MYNQARKSTGRKLFQLNHLSYIIVLNIGVKVLSSKIILCHLNMRLLNENTLKKETKLFRNYFLSYIICISYCELQV